MKGLLLKDLYIMKKRWFLIVIMMTLDIISILIGTGHSALYFLLFFPLFLAECEKNSEMFAHFFPYSPGHIVSSRYIETLICILVSTALSAAVLFIKLKTTGNGNIREEFEYFIIMFSLSMIMGPVISLPVLFGCGYSKGRVAFVIICAILFFGSIYGIAVLMPALALLSDSDTVTFPEPTIPLFLISIISFPLSWRLSIKILKNRDFS